MTETNTNRPLVIYHADCLDGFLAAMLAWKCLFHDEAEYKPMQYGDPAPDVTGRKVFILDFSFPRDVLLQMRRQSGDLLVFDHHKTAAKDLDGFDWCFFDEKKCGARVFWDWLRSKGLNCGKQENEPWFMVHIEDRDLWTGKIASTSPITTALRCRPRAFGEWSRLASDWGEEGVLITEGFAIQRFKDRIIAHAVMTAREIELCGHTIRAANCSDIDCISEIGHALAVGHPFAAVYFDTGDKQVWNLRSTPDGVDVSEIAKRFGGGGHRNSAGFVIARGAVQAPMAGPLQSTTPGAPPEQGKGGRKTERSK